MFTNKRIGTVGFVVTVMLLLNFATLYSQCDNAGFETGTFANWQGATGSNYPGAPIPAFNTMTPGIVPGRHTITTGPGFDPSVGPPLTIVAPASTFSARLGNNINGAQYERLRYAFTVSPNNNLIIYKYAVVFENPTLHQNWEMPRFEVSLRDQNGNIIPCTLYEVFAGSGVPGFTSILGGAIVYRPWTTVGVDVTAYMGQTITLEFGTADCYQTGHFGYAYVDAACGPLQIDARYCLNSGQGVLTAPTGFSYLWSTGETSQSIIINNPTQGQQISCTITSVTGCVATLNTVLSPAFTTAAFTTTNNCMGNTAFNNTSVYANGVYGACLWNFGDAQTDTSQNPTHVYASPGNYNVTLIAMNDIGCLDTIVQPVTIYPTPIAAFTLNNSCFGDTVHLTDQSTIQQGTINQWSWNLGDNSALVHTQNGAYVYPDTGSYNISLIVSENGNCPDTITKVVNIKSNPIANFTTADLCYGLTNTFTNQSTATWGTVAYAWDFGDAAGTANTQNPTYTYTSSGLYNASLIVTQTDPLHTCADTVSVPVNIYPVPIADFIFDQYLCLGEKTVFSNNSSISSGELLTYNWDLGDATTSVSASPQHTYANFGTYNITLISTSTHNCADTITLTENIYAIPVAGVTPDVTAGCEPLTVNYNGQSTVGLGNITGWNWNLGDATTSNIQNPVVTYQHGTYNASLVVSAGDINKTCYDTVNFTINSYAVPVAAFTSDEYLCLGLQTDFINQSSVSTNEQLLYSWDFDDTNTSALTSPSHTYANFGTYNASLIVTTLNNCADTVEHPQNIYAIPTAAIVPDVLNGCQPLTVVYDGQGTVGLGNITGYAWNLDNSVTSTLEDPTSIYPDDGTFNISLVVAAGDANNTCYDTAQTSIDVYPLPVADFVSNNVCIGNNTNFNSLSTVNPPSTIQNYAWSFGDAAAGTSSLRDPVYLYGTDGTFDVELITTTDHNCIDTITRQVQIYPMPVVQFTGDTLASCTPVHVSFVDQATVSIGNIVSWLWDFGDGFTSGEQFPVHNYENTGVYTVTLTVNTDHGCSDFYTSVNMITAYPNPVASFVALPTATDELNSASIGIDITNNSQGATVYSWDFGNHGISSDQTPRLTYDSAGTYVISLYVENQWGCSDEMSQPVVINPVYTFYIPNAFTPNGDNVNDYFFGSGTNIVEYEMYIFNRWGEMIFASYDMDNMWNGNIKGTRVLDDVYIYMFKIVDVLGGKHVYRGSVTLLK